MPEHAAAGGNAARALATILLALAAFAVQGTLAAADAHAASAKAKIVRVDRPWTCRGKVNLALVKVTMRTANADAVYLRQGCRGRIDRIEITTRTWDGLKVNAVEPVAHDLVIGGGFVRCRGQTKGHQDGVQVMGGRNITFRKLEINCNSRVNAQLFISGIHGAIPQNVVCVKCVLGGNAASTLFIANSRRSGARDSVICTGRYFTRRIQGAIQPVDVRNRVVRASDDRCRAP